MGSPSLGTRGLIKKNIEMVLLYLLFILLQKILVRKKYSSLHWHYG
jgi:hypothetical protein